MKCLHITWFLFLPGVSWKSTWILLCIPRKAVEFLPALNRVKRKNIVMLKSKSESQDQSKLVSQIFYTIITICGREKEYYQVHFIYKRLWK